MSQELNPYRSPVLDLAPERQIDPLYRTRYQRIAGTTICTAAAFWCLFPIVAFLDGLMLMSLEPSSWLIPVLMLGIGVAAFFLGLCIRRDIKRYMFSLCMIILTMILLFPFVG